VRCDELGDCHEEYGEAMIVSQCYERTLKLVVPNGHGTAFTITRHGRQWLITAQHIVEGFPSTSLSVVVRGVPVVVTLTPIPLGKPGVDIAVFHLDHAITPELDLRPTSEGLVYSQDVYFLGYPYDLGIRSGGVTVLPFVKKAIISASESLADGSMVWYLDGINNVGFSGGPVVFNRQGSSDWHVVAVVHGYRFEDIPVKGAPGSVPMNTGIIVSYDIRHAVDAIDAYVSGQN
jgi:hypothetical protein